MWMRRSVSVPAGCWSCWSSVQSPPRSVPAVHQAPTYTHSHMHACTHIYTRTCTPYSLSHSLSLSQTHVCILSHIYTHTHVRTLSHTHTQTHAYTLPYARTCKHTHTHAYVHTSTKHNKHNSPLFSVICVSTLCERYSLPVSPRSPIPVVSRRRCCVR
jgi:ABC-type nickel/cobalt efflux system permease component RcnA